MSEFNYKAGLHNVGSYQISGIPYITSSIAVAGSASAPTEVIFPSITQKIMIHNHDPANSLRLGFSVSGTKGTNYWIVDHEDSNGKGNPYLEMRVRTDRIFLLSNTDVAVTGAFVMAELTGITLNYELATTYSGSRGIG